MLVNILRVKNCPTFIERQTKILITLHGRENWVVERKQLFFLDKIYKLWYHEIVKLRRTRNMKNLLIVLAAICAIVLLLALDVLIILGITFALVWFFGLFGISTFLGFPLFQTLFVILVICSIIGICSRSEK